MEVLRNAVKEFLRSIKALPNEALVRGVLGACTEFEDNGDVAGYACAALSWLDKSPELQRKAASTVYRLHLALTRAPKC